MHWKLQKERKEMKGRTRERKKEMIKGNRGDRYDRQEMTHESFKQSQGTNATTTEDKKTNKVIKQE